MIKQYVSRLTDHPATIEDIALRRANKETHEIIAEAYNVSKETVQKFCKKHSITSRGSKKQTELEEKELQQRFQAALKLWVGGLPKEEAVAKVGLTISTFNTQAKRNNVDLDEARQERSRHQYDGRVFGWWKVVPGSYILDSENSNKRSVECICLCGTKRRVQINNLLRRVSNGCGCRNEKGGRKRIPWKCLETGQKMLNTRELADYLGVEYLALFSFRNKNKIYTDSQGRRWAPLHEESIEHFINPDSFKGLISGEINTSELLRETEVYLFTVLGHPEYVKIGISYDAIARSKVPDSKGIYGEFIAAWRVENRIKALIVEEALLRDKSLKTPRLELKHLEQLSGYTEIRKANASELAEHAQFLVNSVEEAISWQKWALQNIPGLSHIEVEMINNLIEPNSS